MSYWRSRSVAPSPESSLEMSPGLRVVAGDDGALALEACLAEQLVELAGLVDAGADEHGVAAAVHQPRLGLHVEQDVVDDLLGPRLGADDLLHRAPALLQLGA